MAGDDRRFARVTRSVSRTTPSFGLAVALAIAALGLLPARSARAECVPVPDPPATGGVVTCTDADPDGFVAPPGVDELDVSIDPGATVGNGDLDATPAIGVNDESEVDNRGAISASGTGAHGIAAGLDAVVINDGAIVVSGDGSDGVRADDGAGISSRAGATIDVSGGNNAGVRAGDLSTATNAGTITVNDANSFGIVLDDDGSATNSGTIDLLGAGGVGLSVDRAITRSSSATNSGTINVSGDGGTALRGDDGSSLTNSDTIAITGSSGVGLQVGRDGSVTNSGTGVIDVTGGGGTAILVGDGTRVRLNPADEDNTLRVTVSGDDGRGVVGGSDNMVDVGSGFGESSIQVTGSNGIAISLESGAGIAVFEGSLVEASGTDGVAIRLGAGGGGGNSVGNLGEITAAGTAIDLTGSMGDTATPNVVTNLLAGSIIGQGGTAVLGGGGVDELENWGVIEGDVLLEGGDDLYRPRPEGALTGSVDGGAGTDLVSLEDGAAALGTLGLGALDLGTIAGFETLTIDAPQTLWTLSGSADLGAGGTVEVKEGSSVAIDGVVGVTGSYDQADDTRLTLRVHPDGTSDRLDVNGAVTIAETAFLDLVESAPLGGSATFTLLTYDSISGEFATAGLLGDSAFLSATADYGATALQILLERVPYVSAATTPNQLSVAGNLDSVLAAGAAGDMATVLGALDLLSADEFQLAASQLSPEIYDAQTAADLALGSAFADLLTTRPLECRESAHPSRDELKMPAPCSARGLTPWGALIGDFGNRDGGDQHVSYDWSSIGGAMGVDARPADPWLLSAEVGGSYTWLGFGQLGGGNLATVEVGAAATYLFERAHLRGVVEYGHGWHTTRRDIDFLMRRSDGRHQSDRVLVVGEAAYEFPVPYRYGTLGLEPIGTVDYAYLSEGAVRESGAGSVSLDVNGRSNSVVSTSLGVRFSTDLFKYRYVGEMLEWADGIWRPEIDVRWREFWTGDDRAIHARFAGAPAGVDAFRVQATDARRGAEVGVRLGFQPWKWNGTIGVGYQAFVGDGTLVQQAVAGVRVPLP